MPFAPGDVRWAALDPGRADPDAVVVASASNSVQIYRPDPATGTYQAVTIPVGANPVSVTVATLAGQTVPDLFVANQGSNDVSVIIGSIVNGLWEQTPGPRLKSAGFGPIATNLVSDPASPGGFDLTITNADGTVDVLPGRGNGFFDDRNPTVIPVGAPLAQPPAVVPGSGVGYAVTGGGDLIRFDLGDPTSPAVVAFTGQDVLAAQAVPDGRVVVALADGQVEVLAPQGDHLFVSQELVPESGLLPAASALQVLE